MPTGHTGEESSLIKDFDMLSYNDDNNNEGSSESSWGNSP